MDVTLVMFKQDGQKREFSVKKESTVLGRNTDCDFQIPLGIISRRHCQITLKEGELSVRDLGSSNGTYVNGKRVQESPLVAGDMLVLGPVIFTVVIDGQPEDVKPMRTVVEGGTVAPVNHPQQEDGTVDVEAAAELEEIEEIEEVDELEEVDEEDHAPAADNPLAALEALSRKKK